MISVLFLALLSLSYGAVLDPTLTEWHLVESNFERFNFPLRDYILEVKAFLPETYNTNPSYGELLRTDKPTTMMVLLYENNYQVKNKVGRLVWNKIKYDRGFDVAVEECDARYEAYPSFPANKQPEQIWAWNFFEDFVELSCNDVVQYSQIFSQGDVSPMKPQLPQTCQRLGAANVNKIELRHMKGEYIRGRPKVAPPTDPPTTAAPTTEPVIPGELRERLPTCDCWRKECGYCSNMECAVQHDLINSDTGIQVFSNVDKESMNSIRLFSESGEVIGTFQWNLKGIFLTGCVGCRTPRRLRKARNMDGGQTNWEFALKDGVVSLRVGTDAVYEHKLRGECKEVYSQATRFASTT